LDVYSVNNIYPVDYRDSLLDVSKKPMPRSSKGIPTKIWLNEGSVGRGIRNPYKRSPGFSTWHSAELGEAQRPAHEAIIPATLT